MFDAVVIYDSSHYPSISLSTKKAICLLVQPKSDVLLFDVANCMSQTNGSDCGLHLQLHQRLSLLMALTLFFASGTLTLCVNICYLAWRMGS